MVELPVFDPNQPIQNFLASRDRIKQERATDEAMNLKRNALVQNRESSRIKQQAAAFDRDVEIQNYGKKLIANIDPDAEDFQDRVFGAVDEFANTLTRSGYAPEFVNQYVQGLFKLGYTTPDGIRVARKQQGLDKDKPLPKTAMGAFLMMNPEATPDQIVEFNKKLHQTEKKETKPKTAMAAFLNQKPDASPDEIAAFAQKLKGKGMGVTLPDGTVIQMGGSQDLERKTKGEIEGKILSGREQLERIYEIKNDFKPSFLEFGPRLGAAVSGMASKAGIDIGEENKKKLIEYTTFKRKAIENINLYIKELTGAQMSEAEANRLRLAQPDPGEKWYQGDDPVTFKGKLEDIEKTVRAAVARYQAYLDRGLSHAQITRMIKNETAAPLSDFMGAPQQQMVNSIAEPQNTVTVVNPDTGETEVWDLETKERVK